jgi:hypothetical protein
MKAVSSWAAVASGALVTATLVEFAPIPFAWIGLTCAAALWWLAWRSRGRGAQAVLFNLAFAPLALGGFELYLGTRSVPHADPDIPPAYKLRDDVVGHRIASGVRVRHAQWLGDEPIFDAVYTIDPDGLRVSPPRRSDGDALCVLFFGDSFTFGWGLDDDETIPWLAAVLTGQRHRVYNFAYAGWGAHQMLALLQIGRVEEVVECTPTHALYYSHHDHVRRAAGRSPYDPHGPRFELRGDGGLERRGNFDDEPGFLQRWPRLAKSRVARILVEHFEPQQADFDRFASIVAASRDFLVQRWPGLRFHVLVWNKRWKNAAEYWEGLERRGIAVHYITDVLPGYPQERLRYALGPHDGHPNARANELVARWFVREVLGEDGAQAPGSILARPGEPPLP